MMKSQTAQHNSEEAIQTLIDEYVEKRSDDLRDRVIACYEPYILKYVELLCGKKDLNIYNADTRKFLNLFIIMQHRNEKDYPFAARKIIHLIRQTLLRYDHSDMYNYIITVFCRALARYKPMIAYNTTHKKPISFTHYIQIRIRFGVQDLIRKGSREILMGNKIVEYNDTFHSPQPTTQPEYHHGLAWVLGQNNSELFKKLSVYERYLVYVIFLCGYNSYEAADVLGRREHKTRDLKKYCRDKIAKLQETLPEL